MRIVLLKLCLLFRKMEGGGETNKLQPLKLTMLQCLDVFSEHKPKISPFCLQNKNRNVLGCFS